jgi:hypothetical protein
MYRLATALFLASCAPAMAQQCISKLQAETVIENLGMAKVSSGDNPNGQIVTYANPNTGQFLIVLEVPEASCLITNGAGFRVYGYGTSL